MLEASLEALIAPVVASRDLDYWGARWQMVGGRRVLQVFIDKPTGVGADDCASVSRQLSRILDIEEVGSSPYTLEVSSPGLDRPLFKDRHYQHVVGKQIKVHLRQAEQGKRSLLARVLAVEEDEIVLTDDKDNQYRVMLKNIQRAHVVPSF